MERSSLLLQLPNCQATQALGQTLGGHLSLGAILLLQGELGSGKTTLVQGLAQGLGITDPVCSPTFTLINEYLEGRIPLYHMDLYRLNPEEVVALDLERYWDAGETEPGIVAIEWPDRLTSPPHQALTLALRDRPGGGRQVTLGAMDPANLNQWEELLGHGLLVDEV
ncbi:MAG: tRNA (adenosine(37)-N6)-threonylcarbamoyltransferase complex ATPase subunit type 1 TsaE [Cyanobacteriota bacterium]|nr:tRNA (adenosine(37)-N6)-threonylcarbamoyltransferase complex ATPase subunit type 1 TsaE [Cyanobacteriota bacterium]